MLERGKVFCRVGIPGRPFGADRLPFLPIDLLAIGVKNGQTTPHNAFGTRTLSGHTCAQGGGFTHVGFDNAVENIAFFAIKIQCIASSLFGTDQAGAQGA